MTYNSNDIVEKGVIIESNLGGKKAQVGYDLSVQAIEKIILKDSTLPIILDENSKLQNVDWEILETDEEGYWLLEPNTQYALTFDQGCNFHENEFGRIISRSSLNRAGVIVLGVVFDPGFSTPSIGCTIYTGQYPVKIHNHSRVAQMQVFENNPLSKEELYNGQWQGVANHS